MNSAQGRGSALHASGCGPAPARRRPFPRPPHWTRAEHQHLLVPVVLPVDRPRTRGECLNGPRPCPWLSCRHHLGIEIGQRGHLRLQRKDPYGGGETCSLDVADQGPHMLAEIGALLGLCGERVRQIEQFALARCRLARRAGRIA